MKVSVKNIVAHGAAWHVLFDSEQGTAWAAWKGDYPKVDGVYHVEITVPEPPTAIESRRLTHANGIAGDASGIVYLSGQVVDLWRDDGQTSVTMNVDGELIMIEIAVSQLDKANVGECIIMTLSRIELYPVNV